MKQKKNKVKTKKEGIEVSPDVLGASNYCRVSKKTIPYEYQLHLIEDMSDRGFDLLCADDVCFYFKKRGKK